MASSSGHLAAGDQVRDFTHVSTFLSISLDPLNIRLSRVEVAQRAVELLRQMRFEA